MPSLSFAREHRLKSSFRIRKTFREGKKLRGEFISLFWQRAAGGEAKIKFTAVVSSKTEKRAVRRNRMKRLLREAFAKSVGKFQGGAEGDWVLLAHRIPDSFELGVVEKDVLECLSKLLTS